MSPEEMRQESGEVQAEEFILGPPANPESESERFYAGAVRRVQIAIAVVGLSACVFAAARYGVRVGLGLAIGAVLAGWNFRSLVSAVTRLVGRIVEQHEPASGSSMAFRFIVRIPLIALVGYAIFISSPKSLNGFLVGLCVPVAAIFWEAGYEAFVAFRRGF